MTFLEGLDQWRDEGLLINEFPEKPAGMSEQEFFLLRINTQADRRVSGEKRITISSMRAFLTTAILGELTNAKEIKVQHADHKTVEAYVDISGNYEYATISDRMEDDWIIWFEGNRLLFGRGEVA